MKAVVQRSFGPPEQAMTIEDVPRPTPGPGQVLVRMRATSVNTPDWITTLGVPYVLRAGARPGRRGAIRGSDVAGVVEAVGADVDDPAVGDEVFGSLWENGMVTKGAFAEYALAPASQLIAKPASVSFEDAAASVMSALTTLVAVREVLKVRPGFRLLINGASGGIGTFAIQLAKHDGADVTAVCGPTNLDLVRELGADRAIDYTKADYTQGTDRYDGILDNVLSRPLSRSIRSLAPGGVFIPNSAGISGGLLGGLGRMGRAALIGAFRRSTVRFARTEYDRSSLNTVADLLESGAMRPIIDHVYAFEDTPKAVAHMAGHHARGNIVIAMT